eukprot:TRINITY_DN11096_c0_g2_i6.p1 TRINITY_DN11096_c0_g2~~TRINITY_DN11096_c0_g2_i6.p1  ORF type:complete len:458 (+),score=121.41 TRINITY_DN11096_c0_g2_i6:146-1519(+)
MIRRPPRSTLSSSSAASDVYKRQVYAAAAAVGFQGEQPAGTWSSIPQDKVISLAKHYAAYGAAAGGLNGAPAEMSERTLREFFLPGWRAFARAGGKGAMTAHNSVLDRPCHAHPWLVNTVFRKELGFGDGIIVSDCNDIEALVDFRVAQNITHAAAAALIGGVDLDLQCGGNSAYTELDVAIRAGLVNTSVLDKAVRRVLAGKFAAGLFEKPLTDPGMAKMINSKQHQQLALRAAEEGVVLLMNRNRTLPLPPHNGKGVALRIGVIGPNGGCARTSQDQQCPAALNMLGSYTQYAPGIGVEVPTIHEALSAMYPGTRFAQGANINDANLTMIPSAVTLAQESDVAVVVLGDDLHSSSEWGDRDSLDLPGGQLPLLQAVVETGTPVILVTITGRTPTFGGPSNAILGNIAGLLSGFRPGQMGGVAIANLIAGVSSPSGKLAQSWVPPLGFGLRACSLG